MSIIEDKSIREIVYDLDHIKNLIAINLNVPVSSVNVQYLTKDVSSEFEQFERRVVDRVKVTITN